MTIPARSIAKVLLLLVLWASSAQAQIVQFKEGALDAQSVTLDAPLTTGNTAVIITRSCDASYAAASSVTDASNTYALAGTRAAAANAVVISAYYKVNIIGGNSVITANGLAGCYLYVFAMEISSTYNTFGSFASATGTGVTDVVSGAITTSSPSLLISHAGQNNFSTYTAGADYTLIDGGIVGAGGAEYAVSASPLSSYVSHITSDITNVYAMVTLSFLAPSGGTGFLTTGVGR